MIDAVNKYAEEHDKSREDFSWLIGVKKAHSLRFASLLRPRVPHLSPARASSASMPYQA